MQLPGLGGQSVAWGELYANSSLVHDHAVSSENMEDLSFGMRVPVGSGSRIELDCENPAPRIGRYIPGFRHIQRISADHD